MAKNNPLFILVIVLVGVFLMLLLTSSQSYSPYEANNNYAKYEPMTTMPTMPKSKIQGNTSSSGLSVKPTMGANTSSSGISVINNALSKMISSSDSENFEPMVDSPQTIQYSPFRDSEIIDKFSQVTTNGVDGVNGCVSSGLSNAGGYICLTPDLIKLLKTRGGNASGM